MIATSSTATAATPIPIFCLVVVFWRIVGI
jgi:hypothetical protein